MIARDNVAPAAPNKAADVAVFEVILRENDHFLKFLYVYFPSLAGRMIMFTYTDGTKRRPFCYLRDGPPRLLVIEVYLSKNQLVLRFHLCLSRACLGEQLN